MKIKDLHFVFGTRNNLCFSDLIPLKVYSLGLKRFLKKEPCLETSHSSKEHLTSGKTLEQFLDTFGKISDDFNGKWLPKLFSENYFPP